MHNLLALQIILPFILAKPIAHDNKRTHFHVSDKTCVELPQATKHSLVSIRTGHAIRFTKQYAIVFHDRVHFQTQATIPNCEIVPAFFLILWRVVYCRRTNSLR